MGAPAARRGDITAHGTPLGPGPGCATVLIGGQPAWRAAVDTHVCPLGDGTRPHVGGTVAAGSVTGARSTAPRDTNLGARRRDQGPARGRCADRTARPLRARSADARVAESSAHRAIYGLEGAATSRIGAGDGAGRGPTLAEPDRAGRRCRRRSAARSRGRSPTRSKPRTSRASSIATSSRPTSRSAPTARSRCSTSAWRRRWPAGVAGSMADASPTITTPAMTGRG